MQNKKYLKVLYNEEMVGTLAYTKNRQVAFQYDNMWIQNGFSLNPFYLPLKNELYINNKKLGMPFGVFLDSLPDAWGELLLLKKLKKDGVDVDTLNILDKLSIVSTKKMGRLYYEPSYSYKNELYKKIDFDTVQKFSLDLIEAKNIEQYKILDKVYRLAGSTGGARPKINFMIDGEEYIVKFAAHIDNKNTGFDEYVYNEKAKKCGINVSDYKLLKSKECKGYFASKRFDNIYTVTIAGLLDVDYNIPSLDYNDIFKLVKILTFDNQNELYELYRRMCFNIYFKNQDDHAKNFSMQYDRQKNIWHLSPAYDLTKSITAFGEQTTTVNGKGKNITDNDLLMVGKNAGLNNIKMKIIMEQIKDCI